jgi:hypothetical protein
MYLQIVAVINFGAFILYGADVMEGGKQIRREEINRSIISAYLGSSGMLQSLKIWGGQVVMRRAAAAQRHLLVCQNLGGRTPPCHPACNMPEACICHSDFSLLMFVVHLSVLNEIPIHTVSQTNTSLSLVHLHK